MLLALGLGTAWKRGHWMGMIPLIILVSYFLANSLSRTSGGRYLVPADWVVLIYYVLGLFTVAEIVKTLFVKTAEENISKGSNLFRNDFPGGWGVFTVLLVSFSAGSLIPLAQTINSPGFNPPLQPSKRMPLFLQPAAN